MIHYHGTPITPRSELTKMAGRHFCVSFANPKDSEVCMRIGQSVMWDNGAFSAYTRGAAFEADKFAVWLVRNGYLAHPHWAVIPDVIGGTVEQQREMLKSWPHPKELSAPVWHMDLSTDYLLELADNYPRICLGSSGEFWEVGGEKWCRRMDEAFNSLVRTRQYLPWIHGMRMLGMAGSEWPLASADSTNVAQNFKRDTGCAECKAAMLDPIQTPNRWYVREEQSNLCF